MRAEPIHRGIVTCRNGVVASSHPLASAAGLRVLMEGGNFMDAAIATSAVLPVVEPAASHLGGDGFMLVYTAKDGKVTALNGSGAAPREATAERFPEGIPLRGLRAASVPGLVDLWCEALGRFGTKPLAELLRFAIRYAEEGFPVNQRLAETLRAGLEQVRDEYSRQVLAPQGRPPRWGEIWQQPDLAWSLQQLARSGRDAFYRGPIAERILAAMEAQGGLMRAKDLEEHHTEVTEPLVGEYRGHIVYEQPPPSQGFLLLEELHILEGFDLAALGFGSPEAIHLMVEAKKLAFADKECYNTDPRFAAIPMRGLLSKEYAAQRRREIDPHRARLPEAGNPFPFQSTTYFCVADREGNAVSFIQSVFHSFGCGVFIPGTGILFNNRMNGFSLNPYHVNFLQPGKRTNHTLNTYMVFREGRPLYVGGTPGGDVQVQTNLQILTNLLDFGMNVQEAIEAPRWQSGPGLEVVLEARFPRRTLEGLRQRGHQVSLVAPYGGSGHVQLIQFHASGAYLAGSDPRCDGCAMGF